MTEIIQSDYLKKFSRFEDINLSIFLKKFSFVILLLFFTSSCKKEMIENGFDLNIKQFPNRSFDFSLWQLDAFEQRVQMGYIIRSDDGQLTMIDGGGVTSSNMVESYIIQLGGKVDTWVITHPHNDHMGVLLELIKRETIEIGRIICPLLEENWVSLHEQKSLAEWKRFKLELAKSNIKIIEPNLLDVYSIGENVDLRILGVKNEEIVLNAINNSSLVFKVTSSSKSVLFTGDLGWQGGDKLLGYIKPVDLNSDYVQMAHHGQNGVGYNFYAAVNACYALWPTPDWLWENSIDGRPNYGPFQTIEVRAWMDSLKIKINYVSGLQKTIQID
jgi:glyoxylase-like metal-dependent hydrolase (beta-lactamase superfamily II)